jgi:IQ and AAA domain-containing protein
MQELVFIGMKPKPVDGEADPQLIDKKNCTRRKLQQAQHKSELDRDLASLKQKVLELEGQDMRETIQDKVNAWFVENRDPETGDYPDFPALEEGGCASASAAHAQLPKSLIEMGCRFGGTIDPICTPQWTCD